MQVRRKDSQAVIYHRDIAFQEVIMADVRDPSGGNRPYRKALGGLKIGSPVKPKPVLIWIHPDLAEGSRHQSGVISLFNRIDCSVLPERQRRGGAKRVSHFLFFSGNSIEISLAKDLCIPAWADAFLEFPLFHDERL